MLSAFEDVRDAASDESAPAGKSPYDIDPLAGTGALDALDSLYDTGGMQFPVFEPRKPESASSSADGGATREEPPKSRNPLRRYLQALRRKNKRVISATAVVACACVCALVWLGIALARSSAVSDELVESTLAADQAFMTGTASTTFVKADPYEIVDLQIASRTVVDDGIVDVAATVELRNDYFDETRSITVRFEQEGTAWKHSVTTDSLEVEAIRGISNDSDYGIVDANPTFNAEEQTCSLEQDYASQGAARWYCTTTGAVKLAYAFRNNGWTRTYADDSGMSVSFQPIVGDYVEEASDSVDPDDSADSASAGETAGTAGAAESGEEATPRFSSFRIESVDDASGTVRGSFEWTLDGSSGWLGANASGSFTATVNSDGTIAATASGSAGSLTFSGGFGQEGVLSISGTVYYDEGFSLFGIGVEKQAFTNATLVRSSSDAGEAGESGDANEAADVGGTAGTGEAG